MSCPLPSPSFIAGPYFTPRGSKKLYHFYCVFFGQFVQVSIFALLFTVGNFQKFSIENVNIVAIVIISQLQETMGECTATATRGEHDLRAVCTHFIGTDDLVVDRVFQKPVLVNAR